MLWTPNEKGVLIEKKYQIGIVKSPDYSITKWLIHSKIEQGANVYCI